MTIPGSANPLLLKAPADGGGGEYTIERSVRFNSADSAYLSRTPASAGNKQSWTWSGWVKRSNPDTGARQVLFAAYGAGNDTQYFEFGFDNGANLGKFYWTQWTVDAQSAAVFRDFSAWYHIAVNYNGSNIVVYVNGISVLTSAKTGDLAINGTFEHGIGRQPNSGRYFSGYLADIHFIDGQALDPTSFTEVDATTGQLIPKAYTGTYGTNGFHLDFSDNSTAAALGTDTSGNSNTWTVNNISVTAGSGNDSLVDTPSSGSQVDTGLGGQVTGNYCTLNPLVGSSGAKASLSNGSLQFTNAAVNSYYDTGGTFGMSSGKWYFELNATTLDSNRWAVVGIANAAYDYADNTSNGVLNAWTHYSNGGYYLNSTTGTGSGTYATGDVVMVAFDADSGKLWFGKNGTWNSGSPAAGTTPVATVSSGTYFPVVRVYTNTTVPVVNLNFGQRQWAYAAPAGFKALCTTNLDTPLIAKPSEVMDVALYTGNGSTQTISGLGFSPDLVWLKSRGNAYNHQLFDTIRGTGKQLYSNLSSAETTESFSWLNAFNSDGFGVTGAAGVNGASDPMVAWTWDAGSSTVTNTDGSITSTVRANPSAGFSIVTYTGNGTAGATVGHGLNVAPEMIIIKNRDQADAWQVYHAANTANPETDYLVLDTTAATADNANRWNDTAPGASVFTLGDGVEVNTSTEDYVAYCFTGVDGYSAMGSYVANSSLDGPFVWTGFRSRFLMIKNATNTSYSAYNSWFIVDTARTPANVPPGNTNALYANKSQAENLYGNGDPDIELAVDILSNGFKLRCANTEINYNATYIYFAVAEQPFSLARAR